MRNFAAEKIKSLNLNMKKVSFLKSLLLLMAAMPSAMMADRTWVDVTANMVKNPNYTDNSTEGWSITQKGEMKCEYGILSLSKGTWNVSQTVAGAPAGKYRITLNGFHRLKAHSDSNYSSDKSKTTTSYLYADTQKKALKNIYSESLAENYKNGCWGYTDNPWGGGGGWGWGWGATTYYYPNNDESASYMLTSGSYANILEFTHNEGDLTFGVKNETSGTDNWAAFTNWKVEFYAETTTEGQEQLVINEIQNMNIDQFMDTSWNYGNWIEVYNPTDNFIELKGCYLSDDPQNLKMAVVKQSLAVGPKGTAVLWFDHSDQYYPQQVGMKLDNDGGTIYLSKADGTLITSQEYPEGMGRISYARTTDGGSEWGLSGTPTPGQSNAGMAFATERWEAPETNIHSQVFSSSLTITVNIPDGATLRYTTDGSTPTADHGETSTSGKFNVGSTQVYRFCFVGEGHLPSKVITRSYIKKGKDAALPIMSITTKSDNLYSDDYGFFVAGNGKNGREGRAGDNNKYNWNMDWERPVNVELMNTDGECVLNQEIGMERCGGWSRAYTPFSFKLNAKKQYELENTLPYDFFAEKPYLRHRTLQMRNGGNNAETWSAGGGRIKDALLQEIIMRSGLYLDCQAYEPVSHYINGQFMGVINMREPNNKRYVYSNYGLDEDEIDQWEMDADSAYVQKCGTKESFLEWYNLSKNCADNEVYDQIKEMVDIDAYINYMAVELYLGGDDWPHNNVKAWKPIQEGGKWKFVVFDLDFAFNRSAPFTDFAKEKTYTFHNLLGVKPDGTSWNNKAITTEIEFVTIFLNMLQNAEFRKQFADTFCIVAYSVFDPTTSKAIINELTNRVSSIQQMQNGYNKTTSPSSTSSEVINKLSNRQSSMITQMKNYSGMKLSGTTAQKVSISSNLPEAKLSINGIPVPTGSFNGQLFPPYTVSASAPAGYRFDGWKTDTADGDVECADEMYELPTGKTVKVVACYSKLTEEEMLSSGLNTSPVVINEVSAGNSINVNELGKKDDWIELYNTTDEDIDLEGMYLTDKSSKPQKYQITGKVEGSDKTISTIIPAHGYKIIWCSKREGVSQLHANFKLDNEDGKMVRLMAADESWADSLVYCQHASDQTVGRYPDGGSETYVMIKSSIQASNLMTSYNTVWTGIPPTTGDDEDAIRDMAHTNGLGLLYNGTHLTIKSEDTPIVTLQLFTTSGMQLALHKYDLSETGRTQLSLSHLPAGIYVARLTDSEDNVCTLKFKK